MNQIRPDRPPCPSRRPLGILWDALPWTAGTPSPWGDGSIARALGCTRAAVRAARVARGVLPCDTPRLAIAPAQLWALRVACCVAG